MHKEPLLFLSHRIPFPPNKGDKIRSFNILKKLSQHFDIYLGSFVDDPFDWQYASKLDKFCQAKCLLNQNKTVAKIKGLTALITGKSISEPYYYAQKMQHWVDQRVSDNNIRYVFIYSSVMAQYTLHLEKHRVTQIVDFVDVDSDKWRQYAEGKSGIARWIYAREHKKLQHFENRVAEHAHRNLFVSEPEAALFRKQVPEKIHSSVSGLLNGVDTDYFNPANTPELTIEPQPDIVFTGAMDYWANIDAVVWFVTHVWPVLLNNYPQLHFFIVGGNPSNNVLALGKQANIHVTGRVEDVRPYIEQGKVIVAPLQIARGIQNKVLEALSMQKQVVATSMAMEGIDARTDAIAIADTPEQMVDAITKFMQHNQAATDNRQWIIDNLQWSATLATLPNLFETPV